MYHPQQQPVFLLDDDHDQWPVHHPASAMPPAGVPEAKPMPALHALPSTVSGYPVRPEAPSMPMSHLHGLGEDDEETESESDRGEETRKAVLLSRQLLAGHRPNSARTGASRQHSPTPSVSPRASLRPTAQVDAAPARGLQAAAHPPPLRGSTKGGSKARKPGGKGGITLRMLIEEGILQPGHNVLSVVRAS